MIKSRMFLVFPSSDWLRGWRKFSGPITEQSLVNQEQSRITFETQLKTALLEERS